MIRVSPVQTFKYTVPAFALAALTMFNSCNKNNTQKPLYDVEFCVTSPEGNFYKMANAKFEEGVSFENNNKKYAVKDGQLMSLKKRSLIWEKEQCIPIKNYQYNIFTKVAGYNKELAGIPVLTANDIVTAKQKMQNKFVQKNSDGSEYYSYRTNLYHIDDNNTHSVYVTSNEDPIGGEGLIFRFKNNDGY